jgi:hypothetical protein
MALDIGLRMSLLDGAKNRGPVHTLQEEITPDMVAHVQAEYEIEDRGRKGSRSFSFTGTGRRKTQVHAEQ